MTNHWVDIKNANLILIMGGNAAEAHPCGFKWVTEAKAHNKAKLIVVDPRFTRSAAVADYYAPIRAGTDIAFLGGVINYLLTQRQDPARVREGLHRRELPRARGLHVRGRPLHRLRRGQAQYDKTTWMYELDADGYAKIDPTLTHPRCVFNLMKQHYARYTPEMVSSITGTPKEQFLKICEMIAETSAPNRTMTILYALGWTQHSIGSQMIRTAAMVQLLLGNIGMAGGGMNALRGHSNIQGLTDLGLLSNLLPGYLTLPGEKETDYKTYIEKRTPKPLRPGQMNYWQNYPKFHVSLMKAWYGDAATTDNNWAFDYLPKLDKVHDILQVFEDMDQGKMNGYICQGFNPLASFPNKAKVIGALVQAQVPGDHRSARHRDLGVLEELRRVQRRRLRPRSRPRCSACPRPASPRRTARWSTAAAGCSGTGRAPSRRARPRPTPRSWPACSCGCASCTRRRAARSRTRS